MKITFKQLILKNFKSHQDLKVEFGDTTQITGDNAKGKSTIPESISWSLYGTDALGGKMDPTPVTYAADETLVQLLLEVDGKPLLLGRGLKKGKAQYYINEVPSKAQEFKEIVEQLFDKELFLSLYNPFYFPSLHWEKQRSMLLQYVIAPANKEVLKHMPEEQGKYLGTLLKKHSLTDTEKIHKESKTSLDKKYIAAQSRTKTLKEQLDQIQISVPVESAKVELAQIDKQVKELEILTDSAGEKNQAYNKVQSQLLSVQDQIAMSKERWPMIKNEVIEDMCRTCKQPLQDESIKAIQEDKNLRMEQYKSNHNNLIKQRDELKAKLAEMEYIDVSEQMEKIREIDGSGQPLRNAIQAYSQYERLQEQVNQALADEKDTLDSLNTSIFILDSIKAFKSKEAELQGEKVQALFDSLSIKLFEELKNGEIKPTFEIVMDGKEYRKLSLSESIRAGLELREVLSKQSEIVVPCFIDNCESITKFKQPTGQLIISRVIAGQDLKIEAVNQ